MRAILLGSWKKAGIHGYERLIREYTIPQQSSMISIAGAAYRNKLFFLHRPDQIIVSLYLKGLGKQISQSALCENLYIKDYILK